jgi:hypothetical protein
VEPFSAFHLGLFQPYLFFESLLFCDMICKLLFIYLWINLFETLEKKMYFRLVFVIKF